MANAIDMKPSEWVQTFLQLHGKPFSLADYPYLEAIYNCDAQEMGLLTARQIAKCGLKSTLISLSNGEQKKLGDVKPGEFVQAHDANLRPTIQRVIANHDNGSMEVFEVRMQGGASMRVTAEHRLRTYYGFTPVADLKVGDCLAMNERGGVFEDVPAPHGRDQVILTAYMLGDGCCGRGNWSFTSACQEALDEVEKLAGADNVRVRPAWHSIASHVNFRVAARIRQWLTEDGIAGKYSWEKEIPAWVFRLSREDTALFVSRLWATDGMIKKSTTANGVLASYCSTSEVMARQLGALLRKLGIRHTFSKRRTSCKGKEHRPVYVLRILGYDALERFYSVIPTIPGKPPVRTVVATERRSTRANAPPEATDDFKAAYQASVGRTAKRSRHNGIQALTGLKVQTGRLSKDKWAKLVRYAREYMPKSQEIDRFNAAFDAGVWWDVIESITPVGLAEVCDIEVEGDHCYVADLGIVSHNSTTLASMLTEVACNSPRSTQVAVSPLQEQAYVFSMSRLKDFLSDSPFIKRRYFNKSNRVDQVLRKVLDNGSEISLGYASRTADRLRGRSIVGDRAGLLLDEVQDIFPEVLEVLKPMAFRNVNARYLYGGTPKSFANHMEGMRNRSTGNEWAVKCQATGCKKWNYRWDERNVGDRGVVCAHCRQPIDVRPGQWIQARKLDTHLGKDSRVNMVTWRIPQLIVHPIVTHPAKWIDILGQIRVNSMEKTYNEIFGLPYDSASQPVTAEQVRACCMPDRYNRLPDSNNAVYPPLVMGVDWAFVGNKSFTFITIGGWNPFPKRFEIFYWKRYEGHECDPVYQVAEIIRLVNTCGVQLVACDWGCGQVQNIQLANALGEQRVMQVWHTGLGGQKVTGKRIQWEPNTRKYHLNRTAVLNDAFEYLKRGQINLPRYEESVILCDNILAVFAEYNDKKNTLQYSNIEPDDGLHALAYAMLAGEQLANGGFQGVPSGGLRTPSEEVEWGEGQGDAWPVSTDLYG